MFQMISMRRLEQLLEGERNFLLLDVREPEEYAAGHLEGAVNLPFSRLQEAGSGIPMDRPVILYCSHGSQSMMAARELSRMGYRAVTVSGGLNYYRGRHMTRDNT